MNARAALIKNAMINFVTGAQNRTSIKNLESTIVNNLHASTKAHRIVQFIYGESGIDPRFLEVMVIPTIKLSDADFARFETKLSDIPKKYQNNTVKEQLMEEFKQMRFDRDQFRKIMLTIEDNSGINNVLFTDKIKTPIKLTRIINDTIYRYGRRDGKYSLDELNVSDAVEKIKTLCDNLPYLAFNDIQEKRKMEIPHYWKCAMIYNCILIRSIMNIQTLYKNKITNSMLDIIINQIKMSYGTAFMSYGSAVGILAANPE